MTMGISPEAPVLLVHNYAGVRTLTLNRPSAFNSFDHELKAALLSAIKEAADSSVRAVVITGAGRAFCAGQDLKQHLDLIANADPRVASTVTDFYNPLALGISSLAKPVIASINGPAVGAGAALALLCDLRIAARSSSISTAFANAGLGADTGASFILPRLIGHGRASKMMLLGEKVSASDALDIGLVDDVVDDGDLERVVAALAARLAAGPTRALGSIKAALHFGESHDFASSLVFEDLAQRECFTSADHHEAITAFVEKRPPHFSGG